jgi:hypothetical protein
MMLPLFLLAAAALAPEYTDFERASIEDRTLSYGCSDIVVIGRLKNGNYTPINESEDIIGHGWIEARIEIRRSVIGRNLPLTLPVKYFTHAQIRGDKDFMFVLSGSTASGFEIKHAQLMSVRPVISAECKR